MEQVLWVQKKKAMPPPTLVIRKMVHKGWDDTVAREILCTWPAVVCNMVYKVCDIATPPKTMSPWLAAICNMVSKVWDITTPPTTTSPCSVVICSMVRKVWDITVAPETMSPWPSQICNMVYKVWDITAAREIKSPSATVIGNMVCKVWGINAQKVRGARMDHVPPHLLGWLHEDAQWTLYQHACPLCTTGVLLTSCLLGAQKRAALPFNHWVPNAKRGERIRSGYLTPPSRGPKRGRICYAAAAFSRLFNAKGREKMKMGYLTHDFSRAQNKVELLHNLGTLGGLERHDRGENQKLLHHLPYSFLLGPKRRWNCCVTSTF